MIRLAKFALTMLALDAIYLSSFSGQYNTMMKTIQKSPLKMKPLYALGVYMLMILGWKLLIDRPNERQSNIVRNSILLGLVIYGVFDFTNLAIFDNYSLKLGLIDILWGGLLFGISSYVATKKLKL